MKSTTAALLISASREFLGYYARLLKSEDFEIIKARGYHDWSEKRHLFQFDVCLIDNEDGEFDFETFFDYISRYNPHAVVLNFGHEPPAPPSGHNYLYCGAGRQISAASFIRNLSEGFRRARARTELACRKLAETTDTVAAIAARCGFGTAETMRRTFARRLGVSPTEYRRRLDRHGDGGAEWFTPAPMPRLTAPAVTGLPDERAER